MTNPNHTDTSRSGNLVERHCNICKRPLDNPSDPMSLDCGGDCLRCMAVIAEDPDCAKSCIEQLEAEIARKDEALRNIRALASKCHAVKPDGNMLHIEGFALAALETPHEPA